eukprot:scaffold4986_cov143-Pinguiococcus_pyrenoidosus.AAC.1
MSKPGREGGAKTKSSGDEEACRCASNRLGGGLTHGSLELGFEMGFQILSSEFEQGRIHERKLE